MVVHSFKKNFYLRSGWENTSAAGAYPAWSSSNIPALPAQEPRPAGRARIRLFRLWP
jgi:hypothetical protein